MCLIHKKVKKESDSITVSLYLFRKDLPDCVIQAGAKNAKESVRITSLRYSAGSASLRFKIFIQADSAANISSVDLTRPSRGNIFVTDIACSSADRADMASSAKI